jgi:hypothetical protein
MAPKCPGSWDPAPTGSVFNWPPGSIIHSYGSKVPDWTEIFTDPQHWLGGPGGGGETQGMMMYCSGVSEYFVP